ncbi:hypothetical protein [Actinomadura chokoriensis]|uniref:hypothetical protein n=1 Tax=Actinomadura chokoriensis TaxID=454156 RepID=UPI0031F8DD05
MAEPTPASRAISFKETWAPSRATRADAVLVTGATGEQGGGALVRGDLGDVASLKAALDGARAQGVPGSRGHGLR